MPVDKIIDDEQTLAESGFYWREKGGLRLLVCEPLEAAGFANGFSTRLGGVSDFPKDSLNLAGYDEDPAENIEENRRRFLSLFPREYRLATAWQVHGSDVKIVKDLDAAAESSEKFDALVSDLDSILAGVKTADCVPVLIGDTHTRSFAAVHAGWRGTVNSITVRAVEAMQTEFGSKPADMVAAVGPAAGCENYEIGPDVIGAFAANFSTCGKYFEPTANGHALIDLHMANKDQLLSCGVPMAAIYTAPFCTIDRTDLFFSYRVEKKKYGKTGRLLSVIGHR
jgi:YfiH family protein